MRLLLIICFSILFFSFESMAQKQKLIPDIFSPKSPTPNRKYTNNYLIPKKFHTTNNLVRKTGSFYQAQGEIIFVKGQVTDSFGVPISGAVIEIWQTNSIGKYQSILPDDSDFIDENFTGSGRVVTDNLGNYNFITIFPGSYLDRAPHINLNIYHDQFGVIETEIYFEDHPLNIKDYYYLSYSKKDREDITAKFRLRNMLDVNSNKIFIFNIVMEGVHLYKNFGSVI
jgi:protocatechuate 3,4-dioxygenase, beta subunit